MALKLITAPTSEPLTLEEAKAHLRVDHDDEDTLIYALIVAARQGAEHITERALMTQTWELALDWFPCVPYRRVEWKHDRLLADAINIPKPPLVSIVSVKYIDTEGVQQTLDSSAYLLDSHREPARILSVYATDWPDTREQANAVLIRFTCGYADAASVPQEIKQWMLLQIGMMYENRESVAAGTISEIPYVDRLLDPYRFWGA